MIHEEGALISTRSLQSGQHGIRLVQSSLQAERNLNRLSGFRGYGWNGQ